jgi:hypothetical protein
MADKTNFFSQGIRVVKITDWLNWATRMETTNDQWAVVLPMIQRGSVWKPHQVIDLWDTIFRGMPFGGLMASHIPAASGLEFFHPLTRKLVELPANGGLSLIDGQQRTLAMLIAWPSVAEQMQRRIWVDFGEDDNYDHLLRLHFTSESSPMGYQRGGPSGQGIGRLSLSERRLANATYSDRMKAIRDTEPATNVKLRYLHDSEICPWHSTCALDLRFLIDSYLNGRLSLSAAENEEAKHHEGVKALHAYVENEALITHGKLETRIGLIEDNKHSSFKGFEPALLEAIIAHLKTRIVALKKCITNSAFAPRIDTLAKCLELMAKQHFPVIEVPEHLMRAEEADEKKDPPLAILFKRIGTGGTDLKTSDYVYSVLKHLNPGCHSLVEAQLTKPRIAAIFTPTDLVMSAVRLVAAQLEPEKDQPKLDKAQFTRLLRGDKSTSVQDPKKSDFFVEFNKQIGPNGAFVKNLDAVLNEISFRSSEHNLALDIGLPLHALSLVHISALEVVLYWLQRSKLPLEGILQENRHTFIRFILCWHLTVLDAIKATKECFKLLSTDISVKFPEAALFHELTKQELALPMCSPQALLQQQVLPTRVAEKEEHAALLVHSSDTINGLRGWRRFVAYCEDALDEPERMRQQKTVKLYERWWNLRGGYSHALLLWLQRDYVHRHFATVPAQPGTEDDTPYDYDHICPASHWGNWTGKTDKTSRLIDFHAEKIKDADKQGSWRLGNAIGNVRVWDSSDNRSDGDTAPTVKLRITDTAQEHVLLRDSAITFENKDGFSDEMQAWKDCSPVLEKTDDPKFWTQTRALAFQNAIELRTFNLYQSFFADLKFAEFP